MQSDNQIPVAHDLLLVHYHFLPASVPKEHYQAKSNFTIMYWPGKFAQYLPLFFFLSITHCSFVHFVSLSLALS